MAIEQIEPFRAYRILTEDVKAVYLDVRSEEEFAQGHPTGAINIPIFFFRGPGQPEPNPEFLAVAEKVLRKDQQLVVGCMAGGRSQRACEALEQAGFQCLANVRGGFGGARDASGAVVIKGWSESELPVSSDVEECGYQSMRAKAGL
jgi:rhodanese-related sulfurtransferase